MKFLVFCAPLFLFSQEGDFQYGNPSQTGCEEGIHIEVFGDFICAQPMVDGLSYAIRNDVQSVLSGGETSGGPILDLKFAWEPAFRIAASYVPGLTARFVWMHLLGKSSSFSHVDLSVPGVGLEGVWAPVPSPSVLYATASFHWDLSLNVEDLELGRCYRVSRFLTMNPSWSIRLAQIDQQFSAYYGPDQVRMKNDFWGGGIRCVFDSQWEFVRDFSFFVRAAASLLYGRFETSYLFFPESAVDTEIVQTIADSFYRLEPNGECSVGIGWERTLSNEHCLLGFRLGYEAQVFWDQFGVRQPPGYDAPLQAVLQKRNVTMQGFALRGRIVF